MNTLHPTTQPAASAQQVASATEAELIAADLHNNINRAQNAWRTQEDAALRAQMRFQNLPGGPY